MGMDMRVGVCVGGWVDVVGGWMGGCMVVWWVGRFMDGVSHLL